MSLKEFIELSRNQGVGRRRSPISENSVTLRLDKLGAKVDAIAEKLDTLCAVLNPPKKIKWADGDSSP